MIENVNPYENYFDDGDSKKKNVENVQKNEFNLDNYLNTRLKKGETRRKLKVRIVLTQDIDGRWKMAIPVNIHSLKLTESQNKQKKVSESGYKSFICLNDKHISNDIGHQGCPLCNKKTQIFEQANQAIDAAERKSLCKEAYKYDTKTAFIVRCIERGKENEGVKFWRFNKRDDGGGVYDMLKEAFELYKFPTDDNGNEYKIIDENGEEVRNPNYVLPSSSEDIFNYYTGRDIIITLTQTPDPTPGAPDKTTVKINVDNKQTPLAANEELMNLYINDTKDWRDMYRSKSFEYLQLIANDETPVFNKTTQSFVPWRDMEATNKEIEQEAARELLVELVEQTTTYIPTTNNINKDEDLPF